MNPEQANAAVIRGRKSDGPEPLAQAAFIKVVTFVGLYYDFFFHYYYFVSEVVHSLLTGGISVLRCKISIRQ